MLSLIAGGVIGAKVNSWKIGLILLIAYGVVGGVVSSSVSRSDGAGIWPLVLCFSSFGVARIICLTWRGGGREEANDALPIAGSSDKSGVFEGLASQSVASEDSSDWEGRYVAASIAHGSYLNAVRCDLDETQFLASAVGAFDGTLQALGIELDDASMLAQGTTFALRRAADLEMLEGVTARAKGDMLGTAMTSPELEKLRQDAGHVAFAVTKGSAIR